MVHVFPASHSILSACMFSISKGLHVPLPQLIVRWLSLVEPYTLPTVPVELRQAVAVGLRKLWMILLQGDLSQSVEAYCMLLVDLLQDEAEEVRDDMAASVAAVLSSLSPFVENLHTVIACPSPSSSSALQSFVSSLPLVLYRDPQSAFTVLLHLLNLDSSQVESRSSGTSNLLFEEDPLNNYLEEVVVLASACRALKTLVTHHSEKLLDRLFGLAEQVTSSTLLVEVNFDQCTSASMCKFSPWDKPQMFLRLYKVALVSEAVVNGTEKRGAGAGCEIFRKLTCLLLLC
jgi:hypothetical protein